MTQEDKELLLKDISARLPYKMAVEDEYGDILYLDYKDVHFEQYINNILEGNIKPYLFPMSSMTKEQRKEYDDLCEHILDDLGYPASFDNVNSLDYLNKHHIDYRGLIPKGLAIDATGKKVY